MKFSTMTLAAGLAMAATISVAQDASTRVDADTDWAVFADEDPKECWAVTAPKETVNTRDGRTVSVRRGDILLFVTFRPDSNVVAEVSFTGGYPFASGSTATMQIGDATFEMFTEGEYAWPATPEDDRKIVTAMKRGTDAVVTARSSRGTQTQDTFSLLGATAMIESAESRCTS
ncbi:MAG: invasion associated locus B family protein [Pseudomonadota bacterium]